MTALVSGPVYTTKPTALPAASTVFDQTTFSAVNASTVDDGASGDAGEEG